MTPQEIKNIKATISSELEKTKKLVVEYKELCKPIPPGCEIGRVSRMDAINNKSVNEAALRQAESKLKGLEYIELQVDKKDFGLCARCHRPIPFGRILLMPHSRFCVNCAG